MNYLFCSFARLLQIVHFYFKALIFNDVSIDYMICKKWFYGFSNVFHIQNVCYAIYS